MTLAAEAVVSPFIAAGLAVLVGWYKSEREREATVASVKARIDEKEKSDTEAERLREKARTETAEALEKALWERHEEYCRRFDRIEVKIGVSNGKGGQFVDAEFCREVHRNFTAETSAMRAEVREAVVQGREAIRIGHEDREAIKQRLTRLEFTVENLRTP